MNPLKIRTLVQRVLFLSFPLMCFRNDEYLGGRWKTSLLFLLMIILIFGLVSLNCTPGLVKKKKEGSKVMHNPLWVRVGLLPGEYPRLQGNKIHIGAVNN